MILEELKFKDNNRRVIDGLNTYVLVDEVTGVNYIVCKYYNYGSSNTGGVAMAPRLNADGSIYVE